MFNKDTYIKLKDDSVVDIDIYINDLEQIFSSSNYSSLSEKAINKDLEKYILNSVKCYSLRSKTRLVIHTPINDLNREVNAVKQALRNHFIYKAKESDADLQQKFRQWRFNLFIGATFLACCFVLLEFFRTDPVNNGLKMLKESLLIMGWVALWEPVTFILFGWQPLLKKKLYYQKLIDTPVTIHRHMEKLNRSRGRI